MAPFQTFMALSPYARYAVPGLSQDLYVWLQDLPPFFRGISIVGVPGGLHAWRTFLPP